MKYETNVWYGWNGGECPVHPETVVEVQFDTDRDVEKAEHWGWQHHYEGWGSDIIAFRILKEHKEPREVWLIETDGNPKLFDGSDGLIAKRYAKEFGFDAVLFREVVE